MKKREEIDWETRERWYEGMGRACLERYKTFLKASWLDKLGQHDDGFEEAQMWFRKATLAREHIRSW